MKKRKVYLSVINDLSGDQRIHRIASTLVEAGFSVTVVGRKLPDSLPLSPRPYQTRRMKLWFTRGKLFYLEYNLRLFFFLLFRSFEMLNANDLDTLLANYLVARLRRKRLIYDSHEYFTEVPELIERPQTRAIWLRLERWIFPRLTNVYTVNSSLARIYAETYQVPVEVIRNVPIPQAAPPSAPLSGPPILLYQGAVNVGRGIELMIRTMAHLPGKVLWIIGKGDILEEMQALVQQQPHPERILFKGFVPLEQLSSFTQQATLGLSLEEDLGANYRYASPNKVYDYLQAGVPVLVSKLPEMEQTVSTYGVGKVLTEEDRSPERLATLIDAMLSNKEEYQNWQQACLIAREELNWEQEKHKLIQIYQ